MVTVDQMMIKDIPSKFVPFVLPICEVHRTLTRVVNVVKDPEEEKRKLRVLRYCRCEECHRQGIGDIAVINSRVFL